MLCISFNKLQRWQNSSFREEKRANNKVIPCLRKHFATPPLLPLWNDVWETSPDWWCITYGWCFCLDKANFLASQEAAPPRSGFAHISLEFLQLFLRNHVAVLCRLISQVITHPKNCISVMRLRWALLLLLHHCFPKKS